MAAVVLTGLLYSRKIRVSGDDVFVGAKGVIGY
jgi:hypothetical protein